jgi:RND family efflux transporter MFP subunit
MRTPLYLIMIIGLCASAVLALVWTGPQSQATLQPPPPQRVITTEVRVMALKPATLITGQLQPRRKAQLNFEVPGRLVDRRVEPGQQVESGEVLLSLEDSDYRDAVVELAAQLDEERHAAVRDRRLLELIRQEVELQAQEVRRLERLGRESLASRSNYDSAVQQLLRLQAEAARLEHSVATAESRLKVREAALHRAARDLQRTRLTAPFSATIDSVAAEVGDYLTPGKPVVTLAQLDELDLALEVTGEVARPLRLGQEVRIHLDGEARAGTIVALATDPDPATHTHALRIRVTADGLYPGQLARAELPGEPLPAATVVPVAAILREEGQAYLFTLAGDRLKRIPVGVVMRQSEWEVIDGVAPGTVIVARDVAALADGQRVTAR